MERSSKDIPGKRKITLAKTEEMKKRAWQKNEYWLILCRKKNLCVCERERETEREGRGGKKATPTINFKDRLETGHEACTTAWEEIGT